MNNHKFSLNWLTFFAAKILLLKQDPPSVFSLSLKQPAHKMLCFFCLFFWVVVVVYCLLGR